jgi:hypothetical protein
MSDILPREVPSDQGVITHLDTPMSSFLSHSFQLGQDESMYRAVSHITEDQIDKNAESPTLSADDAQKKYGVGDLKFTQPVKDSLAQAMSEREKNRMDQEMWLQGNSGKTRFLPGMAAGILGATANPLDFGSMFIPFVGEAGKGEAVGRIAMALRRGLIPARTFENLPASKLVSTMAQAGMWQGMAEVPRVLESHIENQPMPNIGADELGQMAFAGVLHGLGEGLKFLHPDTHDAIAKQTFNDFIDDKDSTAAQQYIPLDEHVIDFKLRQEADQNFNEAQANRSIFKELDERPILPAVKNSATGEVVTGPSHEEIGISGEHWNEGFVTDKGNFVDRDKAGHLAGTDDGYGYNHTVQDTDNKMFAGKHDEVNPTLLGDNNEADFYNHLITDTGASHPEAMQKVLDRRQETRLQRFVNSPEGQARKEQLRQAAIDKFISDKKQELKNPVSQQTKQTALAKTVPPKDVEKYNGDQDHLSKSLDEDIHGLGGKTPEEQKVEKEKDLITSWLDDAIKKLEVDPTKLHFDPLLLKTLGAPVLRTILIATREAYKVSKDLMQAIKQAFAEHSLVNPEAEKQVFSALTKGDDFRYSIQSELDKPQPFNVKPERFTAQVILSRLQQMPAPERAILKNAGIDEFLKQYGTGMVDRVQLQKFVDAHMPQFEIRPMLNVSSDKDVTGLLEIQHKLETRGYILQSAGEWNEAEIRKRPDNETPADLKMVEQWQKLTEAQADNEHSYVPTAEGGLLKDDFVSRNVSVPIAFEKMENPRTIFLAAPQDVHVGSSHYGDVFPESASAIDVYNDLQNQWQKVEESLKQAGFKFSYFGRKVKIVPPKNATSAELENVTLWHELKKKSSRGPQETGPSLNMLAWAETHVVTMPDGRRVLHVFEEQSDVEQGFEVFPVHDLEHKSENIIPEHVWYHGTRANIPSGELTAMTGKGVRNWYHGKDKILNKALFLAKEPMDANIEGGYVQNFGSEGSYLHRVEMNEGAKIKQVSIKDYSMKNEEQHIETAKNEGYDAIHVKGVNSHWMVILNESAVKKSSIVPHGSHIMTELTHRYDKSRFMDKTGHPTKQMPLHEEIAHNDEVNYLKSEFSGQEYQGSYIDSNGNFQSGDKQRFKSKQEAQKFVDQKLDEYRDKVQPLIKDHKQILLKAATKLAMKEGLDGVVISDPRTAMLTQGHLGEFMPRITEEPSEKFPFGKSVRDKYAPPSQAGGMQQAYGQELPRIMEKITGQKGEQVDMGKEHYINKWAGEDEGDFANYDDFGPGVREQMEANLPPEEKSSNRENFDKAFPGSENISGTFFPTKHLDVNRPFEVFTPKQAAIKVPESIDAAVECILAKIL